MYKLIIEYRNGDQEEFFFEDLPTANSKAMDWILKDDINIWKVSTEEA